MFGRRRSGGKGGASAAGGATPGWDAIDAACAKTYADQRPRQVGYDPPMAVSTNLQGCSAYDAGDHWHYVSYGLSELYHPREGAAAEHSGRGFEVTLRVAKLVGESEPPSWGFVMVNEVARDVNSRNVVLEPGHWIDLGRPVTGYPEVEGAPDTPLTIFVLTVDVQLGQIDTPNGTVLFLQLVGVTAAEKEQMLADTAGELLTRRRALSPLLVLQP